MMEEKQHISNTTIKSMWLGKGIIGKRGKFGLKELKWKVKILRMTHIDFLAIITSLFLLNY